jgi:hypothetical protein
MVNKGIHINTMDDIRSHVEHANNPTLLIVKKGFRFIWFLWESISEYFWFYLWR